MWRLRRLLRAGVTASAIGLGIAGIGPAEAQQLSAQQVAALEQQRQKELARVGLYLAYYDQVNRMAVAQGQLSAAEADARLRAKATDLYGRSFTQAEFAQVVQENRRASGAYFARVEQEVNASAKWAGNSSPEAARQAARGLLEKARRQYETAVAARRDPWQGLMGATVIRGLAMGSQTPPASIDVFGDQWERIPRSMPSPGTRAVMGDMVNATRKASSVAQSSAGAGPTLGASGPSTPPSSASPVGSSVAPPQPGEDEHALWQRVYAANTREGYQLYLQQYPRGQYADIAQAALGIQAPAVAGAPPSRPTPAEMGRPAQPSSPPARPVPGEMGRATPPTVTPAPDPVVIPTPPTFTPPAGGIASMPPPGATMPPPRAADDVARGNALFQQGQYREALAVFDNVLRTTPRSLETLLGRGLALNALGDVAGARQAYEAALQISPAQPNLRSWLAEVAIATNDFARAEAVLYEELRLAPSSAWAYSFIGTLRMLQGRHPEARQAMATAMQIGPVVATHRYQNAAFLSNVGQSQRALVEFWSVLLLDPNMAIVHYGIGVESARLGQTDRAIQAYDTYLRYDGTSQWAQLARQELVRLRGDRAVPNPTGLPPGVTLTCPPDSIATPLGCVVVRPR